MNIPKHKIVERDDEGLYATLTGKWWPMQRRKQTGSSWSIMILFLALLLVVFQASNFCSPRSLWFFCKTFFHHLRTSNPRWLWCIFVAFEAALWLLHRSTPFPRMNETKISCISLFVTKFNFSNKRRFGARRYNDGRRPSRNVKNDDSSSVTTSKNPFVSKL